MENNMENKKEITEKNGFKACGEPLPEHYDRSDDAFALYQAVYGKKVSQENGKLYWKFSSEEKEEKIEVSGDIICNFCGEHLKFFRQFVESDDAFMLWLDLMSSCMWQPYNISVLPVTGGLNNTKQSFGNDRLDAFVWALDLYYQGNSTALLSSGKPLAIAPGNTDALRRFLASFGSAEQFCGQIYQIDKDLTGALCESGKKPIDSAARVREYLELVREFWLQRYNFYQKIHITEKVYFKRLQLNRDGFTAEQGFKVSFAMTHDMKLHPEPFAMIKSGKKKVELRLLDEKRRQIREGDFIRFTNIEGGEQLVRKVIGLHKYDSFEELYKSLPLTKCGYTAETLATADPRDMEQYYSSECQKHYGVVGIELER